MSGERSVARRIALLGAVVAAATALVSAVVPFVVAGLRLSSSDALSVERLARSIEEGLAREAREEATFDRAARDVLQESALEEARIEVWGPAGLVAAVGPGRVLGAGSGPADATPRREGGRVVVRRPTAAGNVVAVALPVSFSRALRREMAYSLLLVVVPLSLFAALVASRLARRSLRPLEALASAVEARRPGARWDPIGIPSADVEIARLGGALNEMGARMTAALAAERELAAYAAHAMRTPLMRLAAQAEGSQEGVRRAVGTLKRLVDSLLLVVRTEPRLDRTGTTVNAADVARQAAADPSGTTHRIEVRAPDEALVRGEEELLLAAVEHLVDNAVRYAPGGSLVTVAVEADGAAVTLSVTDEGPGLAAGEEDRVFEAFVRGAAGAGSDGSGLGLALVSRIARGHGGVARARASGAGTRFEIVLPAWAPR